MKKEIKLSRIHCVGCATNLEDKILEVEGVNNAWVDFEKKTVKLDIKSKEVLEKVEECITSFDSSIKIIKDDELDKQEKREKIKKIIDISRVCLAIVLAVVGFIIPVSVLWLKISIFVLAYLFVGYEVIYIALKNIIKGKVFDENFLMFIATIGALVLGEYVEAIAVMLLYTVGEFFEGLAVERSKKRIKSLMQIKANEACLVKETEDIIVPVNAVKVNDLIRIKPGDRIPLDCEVVEGKASINKSAITGESSEVYVKVGDELLSGSINIDGMLVCRVTKLEKDSTVTKIIELVNNATKSKAKTERFVSKFAKWYTPIVVIIAVLLAVIPTICGLSFIEWGYRALVFLVVSCPCALVLSIPLSFFAGIGAAARMGVLIKGSNYLELLANIETVIFDKTGTLTFGEFEITKIKAEKNSTKEEVLELIAYAESFSNHRIAKSILAKYNKNINTAWVQDYQELSGLGVKATLFGEECLVGNIELLKENNVKVKEAKDVGTIVYIAKSGECLGYLVIEDKIKPDAYKIVETLKSVGVNDISMFTGDNKNVALKVSKELGLTSYYAELLPQDKVENLKKFNNKKIAFVGDGINDAPILASVDVGVSMGGVGSDVAIEAADVVLMTDEPSKLKDAILVAKKTKSIVTQNIAFILFVKLAVLVLTIFGIAGMWLAIFADVGVALLAVLNSLRAMRIKDKAKWKKKRKK